MAKKATIDIVVNTQNAEKNIGELNNEINETVNVTKTLKQQLREMTIELQGLEPGTDRFNELTAAAGQLKDQIADTNAAINATAGSAVENLAGAVTNMAGVGISAFQGIAGAQAMFGSDSEELMKLMAKLQGAMALGQAIKDFGAIGDTLSVIKAQFAAATAGSQLFNKATVAQAVATGQATIAQRIMNAVMSANPVFLIIGGITALVAAFALFSDSSKEAAEEQERLNKSLEEFNNLTQEAIDDQKRYAAADIRNKQLKSTATLLKLENELIVLQDELTDAVRRNSKSYSEQEAILKQIQDKKREVINEEERAQKELQTITNNRINSEVGALIVLKREAQKLLDDEVEYNKKVRDDEEKQKSNERISNYKKQVEDLSDQIGDLNLLWADHDNIIANIEAEAANRRLQLETDVQNQIADIIKKAEEEKTEALKRLNEQEKSLLYDLNTDKAKAINKAYEDEIDAAAKARDIILNNTKSTEKEKEKAKKEYADIAKLAELRRERDLANLLLSERKANTERLETEINNLKTKLLTAQGLEAIALAIQLHEKEKQLLLAQMEFELSNTKLTEEEKLKIKSEYELKIAQLEKDFRDKSLKEDEKQVGILETDLQKMAGKWLEFYNKIASTVQSTLDTINMAFDLAFDNQQRKIDETYNAQVEAAKDAYGEQLISREEYDNQIEALDNQKVQKERALKKKQFDKDKANSIINATIQGAQAVLAALTTPPPLSYVLAAINGALVATQIGIIASQKFTAARGGVVPGSGPSSIDSVDAKLAPGEMVINANSASMFPQLLSQINQAGGGIPLAPQPVSTGAGGMNIYQPAQTTVRAYVVEQDLTNTSRRVRRMEESASF